MSSSLAPSKTSVAILNNDADKVVVTLGNYGNESYVLYCDNMLSDTPTFTPKQGKGLPKMPVYSSVFTVAGDENHVLIGTEHGVYRTTNIAANRLNRQSIGIEILPEYFEEVKKYFSNNPSNIFSTEQYDEAV